jgi:VanZ family protein
MPQKSLVMASWAALAFIAYATVAPISGRPEIDTGGFLNLFAHLDHYIAFAVLGGLFTLAYPRHWTWVCVIVFGSAVLLEIAQLLTPDRHARVSDAVQKMLGGMIGITVARGLILLQHSVGWRIKPAPER